MADTQPTRVLLLGSTGSIGTQALEVIAANPDRFEVVGLAAGGGNIDLLAAQRAETGVSTWPSPTRRGRPGWRPARCAGSRRGHRAGRGDRGRRRAQRARRSLGLDRPWRPSRPRPAGAGQQGVAGRGRPAGVKAAAPGQIVPVDSEHSALAQCLRGGAADEVARLVLTASGGPFRGWAAAELETSPRSRPARTRPGRWAR